MPTSRSAPKPEWKEHILESQTQEKPAQEDPTQLKKQESNTNPEKTKPIASIHPILPKKLELDRCRARVEHQIEYDALLEDPCVSAAQLDEIVSLMTETLCSGKETISVGGEEHPAETVKEQLKQLTSEQLAAKINDLGLHGTSHIQLIIGGSLGLDPAILKRADYLLSFSKMTFPHQLMRVILLEQIYRAYKINAGEPYHK